MYRFGKFRTMGGLLLVAMGLMLIYLGLTYSWHFATAVGLFYVIYGVQMRFHSTRAKNVASQIQDEVHMLKRNEDP